LLSVNVLSNSISADFSFYCCVYSVLSQLSRIVPNNGDSHKSSMHQNRRVARNFDGGGPITTKYQYRFI